MADQPGTDALFRTLMATAVDGIIVTDEHGRVGICNPACERLFGYSHDEMIGRNINVLMPSPYREEHESYLAHYRQTGEDRIVGFGREVMGLRRDGSTFPMYLSVGRGVLDAQTIYVGIVRDLTARNTNARRIQDMQNNLVHVSRLSAMGQMTAGIAHEMNQPLTAALNYLNATRRTVAALTDPQAGRVSVLIDKAVNQISRAGQIIRQLREFVEKRDTSRTKTSLNNVVEEALALATPAAADANVMIGVELEPGLPPVAVDRVQVQQVVINLIRNSLEAMNGASKRELKVSTRRNPEGWVEVTVADNGPGVPAEIRDRLFHPFVTTKENAVGIGLSIGHSIIEAHGGRIWASPYTGEGAAFHFALPPAAEPGN